jgi:hypothetical protein
MGAKNVSNRNVREKYGTHFTVYGLSLLRVTIV